MKSLHLITILFSLFIVGCNFDILKPQAINEKIIVNKKVVRKDLKIIEEVDKEVSPVEVQVSNYDKGKLLKETNLPLTLEDYVVCNIENTDTFCKSRFPTYDVKNLPITLKDDYIGIKYIDTVFKLPSVNNIEVYILARNMTDVEEYTIITYNKKIIDKLLIGRIGSADNSDRKFSISENYKNIEINFNDKTKSYKVNKLGNILGI